MRFIRLPLLFVFLLAFLSTNALTSSYSVCQKALMITKTAERHHYNPREVDDKFSELVFDAMLLSLDQNRLIFSQEDYDELSKFKNGIDEDILQQRCAFVGLVTVMYEVNLALTDSIVNSYDFRKLDITKPDSITFVADEPFSPRDALIPKWGRWLKLEMLRSLFKEEADLNKFDPSDKDTLKSILDQVKKRESCRIQSKFEYEGGIEAYVHSIFLTAVSNAYDPHTAFFSQPTLKTFERYLSKEWASFGFEISRNGYGQIIISGLIPGGPAWKSNELNEGDIILSVESNDVTKDFRCIGWTDVSKFLQAKEHDKVRFRIEKKDGRQLEIELQKEVIKVEHNVIQSFVLEGSQKVGYIYLPSFYTEMFNMDYLVNGCANDVAKELIKLKQEGIVALVLDIRNNGGGSMLEAVLLSGIFIDYGAISIYDSRGDDPQTMKDMNRGVVYSDPLVVLINRFSASSSELFAAAMQDQNRALIVGSRSYGKSTSQTIVPLDAYKFATIPPNSDESTDFIKLTMAKFFRVTGTSHQKDGIDPDIVLPDYYDQLQVGEAAFPNALESSTIIKKTYYYPAEAFPLEYLRSKSQDRIKNKREFAKVQAIASELAKKKDSYTIPLETTAYQAYLKFNESGIENVMVTVEADANDTLYIVKNPSYMRGISSYSDSGQEINGESLNSIQKDIYIRESFLIVDDLLHFNK